MVKLNKIYTRTGDDGSTGLVDGSRIAKDEALIAAIGDVDEANSAIGCAIAHLTSLDPIATPPYAARLLSELSHIQNDLFDLGADIATPATDGDVFAPSDMILRIIDQQVAWLEVKIDQQNENLTPLSSFILPGGNISAANLHMARAISRRAERQLVGAAKLRPINPAALKYLNRLSDYLFTACRTLNSEKGDILWVPGASRCA
ncbi:ATP:cob(I)alamin adenosyltransferase [Sphingorhabdus lutea]|uniref:Corrinoid adenosyltransferase n=1 Tax=Sphingorhabdus lutea TaxID=1913578 RepID=A0A1L3JAH9_9SPHN|nr:cob(I)yrinic acid a,c-diamide adenosyltransferase [Sphingorhabdus lutea]APG62135.1 ATP:cob(I)alamin adenosyltransferase [Sphingorhabdus lutea]